MIQAATSYDRVTPGSPQRSTTAHASRKIGPNPNPEHCMFRPRALHSLAFLLFLRNTGYAQPARISVGPNVQVSASLANDPHFEMWLAVDPANADRLIACSMLWPNDWHTSEVVTYASLDRGKSWMPTL